MAKKFRTRDVVEAAKVDRLNPKVTGAIGGKERARRMTSSERADASKIAGGARWTIRATHMGTIPLCGREVPCANLADGRRVISITALSEALGRSRPGGQTYRRRRESGRDEVPIFLASERVTRFIPKDFSVATIRYAPVGNGPLAEGVDADTVPKICKIWVDAWAAGALLDRQLPTAHAAAAIQAALAHVGIAALRATRLRHAQAHRLPVRVRGHDAAPAPACAVTATTGAP